MEVLKSNQLDKWIDDTTGYRFFVPRREVWDFFEELVDEYEEGDDDKYDCAE